MAKATRSISIVGSLLRGKREALGMSQRTLGQYFDPPVTTQFISNIERGVTPLPPAHVETLARALLLSEAELLEALAREYSAKISQRTGHPTPGSAEEARDHAYFQALYEAFRRVEPSQREAFVSACESLLGIPKPDLSKTTTDG